MGKIQSIGGWSAHACLHAALEEAAPEDHVFAVVIKANEGGRTRFTANMNNEELYYEAGVIQEQVMKLYRETPYEEKET